MWNDEDNNPYGSQFDERPDTPSEASDPADEGTPQSQPARPEFVSRIEQILHRGLPIEITDAGKSLENGSYIVYTIRTGDLEVRRRYSEFASLRATLVNLHPTLIVPPIPEKHSMADYAAKPTKAKEDVSIIDMRKRLLSSFLNRCRQMKEIREDGVWWRFLDPNASWSEVLHSAPVSSIPKSNMKAPPLDPANPTPAHQWLPIPSSSAKLRSNSVTPSGTPSSPPRRMATASSAAHSIPGPQIFGRFPPNSQNLSEEELDPYFTSFESNTRELELLLQGNIERVNRRTLSHLSQLASDMSELGARYNGFSLSEQSETLAAAIERVGQAVDASYLNTEELSATLGAQFSEPMRESAQFAGVVRSVLRFRILKRVQEEMTKDELAKKRALLDTLERSETEAKRIEQYLNNPSGGASGAGVRRSASDAGRSTSSSEPALGSTDDSASADSDFPPTHSEPSRSSYDGGSPPQASPRRSKSQGGGGNFVTNKIFGRISHAVHGIVDVDPERTRRDQIGKTRESLNHLEQALEVSEKDVKDASAGVLKDLKRFQGQKEEDLRKYMIAYARCHIDWAKKNLEQWREAGEEVAKIEAR